MSIVEYLFSLWNNPKAIESVTARKIDREDLNVIVIELLSWLRLERKREIWISQGRKTKLKDMELHCDCSWCRELIELVQGDTELAKVFSIKGNRLNFKDEIPDEYRKKARDMAYTQYNPPLIIN